MLKSAVIEEKKFKHSPRVRPHHCGHLLQVQKESLQPLTLYTSFHDLINVYSRRSGAISPGGQNFYLCQQKPLVTSVICYKFQRNLFEV